MNDDGRSDIMLRVNDVAHGLNLDNRTTLLDALREGLDLAGPKKGLAPDGELRPLQRAFIELDGFQCGYRTSGQLCSAVGMLSEHAAGWPSAVTADLSPDSSGSGASGTPTQITRRAGAYG